MRFAASSAFVVTLAGAAAPDAVPEADPGPPIVILDRPVRLLALPSSPVAADYPLTFRLALEHGAERCTLETTIRTPGRPTTLASAVRRLKRTIGWRHGYLFVRTECGGGNAWKCSSESVFAIREGHMVGLGTLAARTAGDGVGTSWRDGMFRDADTELEINELTSHAGAPWFEIRLRERDGRLVADTDRTWSANARDFAAREAAARANPGPPGKDQTWDSVISPRLGNAAVSRYCGRAGKLAAILAEARSVLPPDRFAAFQEAIDGITPGVLPETSAPPRVHHWP